MQNTRPEIVEKLRSHILSCFKIMKCGYMQVSELYNSGIFGSSGNGDYQSVVFNGRGNYFFMLSSGKVTSKKNKTLSGYGCNVVYDNSEKVTLYFFVNCAENIKLYLAANSCLSCVGCDIDIFGGNHDKQTVVIELLNYFGLSEEAKKNALTRLGKLAVVKIEIALKYSSDGSCNTQCTEEAINELLGIENC